MNRSLIVVTCLSLPAATLHAQGPQHTFAIGDKDFLLDGKPIVIRSGEMHAARVPREYWRHRLQMVRAMGCNAVCAYLFWNQHEPRRGEFDFSGQADIAEYCRLAQEVGLHVILRPGPYACAEWDFGGFPWWLLETPDIALRTRDPRYLEAVKRYLLRVGRELASLQITHGGPIVMVQVENEYGSYGKDRDYIGSVRDDLIAAGFDVPLFTCDGPSQLKNDVRSDIFSVVNFGDDPEGSFKTLRAIRPTGPLMCGEYYPGWFDSWGKPHHLGDAARVVKELGFMLEHRQSFSIYMVHGGTSFGFTSGANAPPFRPQSTSYDYDAPIDEAGRATPKFRVLRELFEKHLEPGETLPEPPPAMPVIAIPEVALGESAPLFSQLGKPTTSERPLTMEMLGLAHGMVLYRTTLAAGDAGSLAIREAHDFAQVYLDGVRIGVLDRRAPQRPLGLPRRDRAAQLDILIEAMGHVNYGGLIHDRKGITQSVTCNGVELTGWQMFRLPFDERHLASLSFARSEHGAGEPALHRGRFALAQVGDTFLDMRGWQKGLAWVNGHALGRYWNLGPQQTLYVPGCWLTKGDNQVVVLDVTGDATALNVRGLESPILDQLGDDPFAPRPHRTAGQSLQLDALTPTHVGSFTIETGWQQAQFAPTRGRYVCLTATSAQNGGPFTTCAELVLLDADGRELPRDEWRIVYADSEELSAEDGAAPNAIDSQADTFWHTQWEGVQPRHPHHLVIDLGREHVLTGLRALPRSDGPNGRIKDFRLYVSATPFLGL